MTNPEALKLSPSQRLTSIIDAKFKAGTPSRGAEVRKHEESLALIPVSQLSSCPTASMVHLERPIPDEEEQAHERWKSFGGHRVSIYESGGRIQTNFFAHEGEVLKRQVVSYPGDRKPLPGEDYDSYLLRRGKELLGDALISTAMTGLERATAVRKSNLGEPISEGELDELLDWVSTATP